MARLDRAMLARTMKEQTIGIEIEMNHITRERAAMVAARYFRTGDYRYTGNSDGYSTWSAWDAEGRKWKFSSDSSITGPSAEQCELVSPILRYEDIHFLQGLVRELRKAGARSDYSRRCGIHVHIGIDGHTPNTLRNLANVMAAHEDLLCKAVDVSPYRADYCRKSDPRWIAEVNKKRPKTMDELSDVWYESQGCDYGRTQHYNNSRYHMINFHATFTKGTVEFRFFQFDKPHDGKRNGIHAGEVKAFIQMCLAMSNYAKHINRASAKDVAGEIENPKYAMRMWMLTMGMIGKEFETAREYFTKRLEGNSDVRWADRSLCTHRAA